MPSLAGFYATPEDCREWVRIHRPERYMKFSPVQSGAGVVQGQISQFLRGTGRRGVLRDTKTVVPPGSSDDPHGFVALGLMLVRYSKRDKVYIPPNESNFDKNGKALVEQHFGLKVSDWRVIWFDYDDPAMCSEFLEPEPAQK